MFEFAHACVCLYEKERIGGRGPNTIVCANILQYHSKVAST